MVKGRVSENDFNKIFEGNPNIDFKQIEDSNIRISNIRVKNKYGEKLLGKKMGYYSTLELPKLTYYDVEMMDKISSIFGRVLKEFITMDSSKTALVVGLGNWNVTSDSLGPKVISKLFVTRHLKEFMPKYIEDDISSVCAISPGVLGTTGIETSEIVKSLVNKIKPDYVLCVDSLAARKVSRLNTTIQVGSTGINPGAGVNNHRIPLNEETLGVPVIGIGIPTVVDSLTIVSDSVNLILDTIIKDIDESYIEKNLLGERQRMDMIRKTLSISMGEMIVAPKDVDSVIESMSKMIAMGINIALHPNLDMDKLNKFIDLK
ncbi:GPR endopeptidase [Candidatus Arthromitus sp. SFB-rat-Yit]|uniref:GPR endopeptidase n=1 Tax=Candidatus Arthromitus sp. SFB-rat-Yit TaxID=1041504 RepID=UPI000227A193|nr:GPR endopeptidase [Candidatus Arthromitus sp. SFB-rat-Yit]BAK81363.1 germination protease [Candidatus Arthromitus sp. SFB-rat-Yit]